LIIGTPRVRYEMSVAHRAVVETEMNQMNSIEAHFDQKSM